jgi:hypothetical protein
LVFICRAFLFCPLDRPERKRAEDGLNVVRLGTAAPFWTAQPQFNPTLPSSQDNIDDGSRRQVDGGGMFIATTKDRGRQK